MMETREPLEWHFKQLDHSMGLSFKTNFNFAIVGHLLKGSIDVCVFICHRFFVSSDQTVYFQPGAFSAVEDCRQAEEPKQLADEANRFHLGRQRQHFAVICSGALLFSSRVLRPSLVTLCSHKSVRCTVELYHASHLWYPPFYTSPMASSALQH